jgi:hypothetical protein
MMMLKASKPLNTYSKRRLNIIFSSDGAISSSTRKALLLARGETTKRTVLWPKELLPFHRQQEISSDGTMLLKQSTTTIMAILSNVQNSDFAIPSCTFLCIASAYPRPFFIRLRSICIYKPYVGLYIHRSLCTYSKDYCQDPQRQRIDLALLSFPLCDD